MRLLALALIIFLSACKQAPSTDKMQEKEGIKRDTVIRLVEKVLFLNIA